MYQYRLIIVAAVTMMVVLTSSSTAQKRPISRKEYTDAVYGSYRIDLSKRVYRLETLEETLDAGVVTKTRLSVSENLPPDRTRYYTKTVENGKASEYEQIKIDYMLYTRQDDGPWSKVDLRQKGGSGYGAGSGSGSSFITCTQYSLENTFMNGVAVRLFESLEVRSSDDELKFSEDRKWIDDEGVLRRSEDVRGLLHPRMETYRRSTNYDFTAPSRIEAPIK